MVTKNKVLKIQIEIDTNEIAKGCELEVLRKFFSDNRVDDLIKNNFKGVVPLVPIATRGITVGTITFK